MNPKSHSQIVQNLRDYNLHAKKSFGQNFLANESVLKKIIETAELNPNDIIIEVGPGLGVLTEELAKICQHVLCLELDKNIIPALQENLKDFSNIEIFNTDALKFSPEFKNYKIVANIPYNITSHLINHFLQTANKPTSLTLLVQKEVGKKICTLEPHMSVLSLQTALFGKTKYIKDVPPSAFFPPPKVTSAIIKITLHDQKDPDFIPQEKALKILQTAKIAFSQKRKKLRNTIGEYLIDSPIDLDRRPETLSVKEWLLILPHLKSPSLT